MSEQIARVLSEGELSIPKDVFRRLKLRTDDRFFVLQDGDDIWLKRIHSKEILEKREFFFKTIVQRAIQLLDSMLDSLSDSESLTIVKDFYYIYNILKEESSVEAAIDRIADEARGLLS